MMIERTCHYLGLFAGVFCPLGGPRTYSIPSVVVFFVFSFFSHFFFAACTRERLTKRFSFC